MKLKFFTQQLFTAETLPPHNIFTVQWVAFSVNFFCGLLCKFFLWTLVWPNCCADILNPQTIGIILLTIQN